VFSEVVLRGGPITAAYHFSLLNSAEIVRWVAESMRPFKIVKDRGFQSLMKTGRPDYYIPSPETVSRDVKKVFVRCRQRIAKILQVSPANYLGDDTVINVTRNMKGR
jgi:hypothetical protein